MKLRSILGLLALAHPAAAQTTWYVDVNGTPPGTGTKNDPYTSLQYAIDQPTTLSLDTLQVAAGTYLETIDYRGKTLSIESAFPYGDTVLDAQYAGPAVRVESGEGPGTRLIGFEVTHGESDPANLGAAVRVVGSNLEMWECRIVGNADQPNSGPVPGIYAEDSPVLIVSCTVQGNGSSNAWGAAGLHVAGTSGAKTEVANSVFADNQGGLGGAIYLGDGTLSLAASLISGNRTNNEPGAGLYIDGATADVLICQFKDNVNHPDHYPGGAIYQTGGSLTAHRCWFEGNIAMRGGAIALDGGVGQVTECRFVGNVATTAMVGAGDGGAVHAVGSLHVMHSLFLGNRALGGGGGGADGDGGALWGNFTADRCTFFGNQAARLGGAVAGGTLVNSIAWRNTPDQLGPGTLATYSDVEGGAAGKGNFDADPRFLDPSYPELHLRLNSPCIDKGDPASGLEQDGTRVDVGAYRFDPAYVPQPLEFCTAKTSSLGFVPQIGWLGSPTLTGSDDFAILASDVVPDQFGLMIWGIAPGDQPFFGGTLCVGGFFFRTPVTASGGAGSLRFDFTQAYMASKGVPPYETLYAQWWFRDGGFPPPDNVGLTGGLKFIVIP